MAEQYFKYIIVGAGLAGDTTIDGIRKHDNDGPILLIGAEKHAPYHRPPLTKPRWLKRQELKVFFTRDAGLYGDYGVQLMQGTSAAALDPKNHIVADNSGRAYRYGKLLLATGGRPRRLDIPGGQLPEVCYFRTLDDFQLLRSAVEPGATALVIGGGFIGSEIAAALNANEADVTFLFPGPYPMSRVFPEGLGRAILEEYAGRGVRVLTDDAPVSIEKNGGGLLTRTRQGLEIRSVLAVAGIGLEPNAELARHADIETGDGILVNEFLETSAPDVYAAGDNACFPCPSLGRPVRVEHWDNARAQGERAGANMAGAHEPFAGLPSFSSDLYESTYETIGNVTSSLPTSDEWADENRRGAIYYLKNGRVCGALTFNAPEMRDAARERVLHGEPLRVGE